MPWLADRLLLSVFAHCALFSLQRTLSVSCSLFALYAKAQACYKTRRGCAFHCVVSGVEQEMSKRVSNLFNYGLFQILFAVCNEVPEKLYLSSLAGPLVAVFEAASALILIKNEGVSTRTFNERCTISSFSFGNLAEGSTFGLGVLRSKMAGRQCIN